MCFNIVCVFLLSVITLLVAVQFPTFLTRKPVGYVLAGLEGRGVLPVHQNLSLLQISVSTIIKFFVLD